ncbi:Dynein heavy chain 6, axonemal [Clydaea vesicula]|uniref:Dynein heavy chain 6, axonemal n=1 Tax=Clydaea vesicula TaxID=447962 RepID=A0AAD5Y3L2_9FUNG|nr:Dynein heavy chain 6, axonemal [Clydaea vesicula]
MEVENDTDVETNNNLERLSTSNLPASLSQSSVHSQNAFARRSLTPKTIKSENLELLRSTPNSATSSQDLQHHSDNLKIISPAVTPSRVSQSGHQTPKLIAVSSAILLTSSMQSSARKQRIANTRILKGEQTASTLRQRLYTTIPGNGDKPHFVVPTKLEPLKNSDSLEERNEISLRAKRQNVIPVSSLKDKNSVSVLQSRTSSSQQLRSSSSQLFSNSLDASGTFVFGNTLHQKRQNEDSQLYTDNEKLKNNRNLTPPVIPPINQFEINKQTKKVKLCASDDVNINENEFNPIFLAPSAEKINQKVKLVALNYTEQQQIFSSANFQTPFQFIEFLHKNPRSKEFAYGVPKMTSSMDSFNPYNLRLIEFNEVEKKAGYYTISREGVTRFDYRGHGEFTPLNQWLREYKLFHSLLKIPFFARYRSWKCFVLWKKSVLRNKINLAKKSLAKNLFFVHPILREGILKIRSKCTDITLHHRLLRVEQGKSYQLEEFINEQKEFVTTTVATLLKQWEKEIRAIVEKAGIECLEEKGFHVSWEAAPKNIFKEDFINCEMKVGEVNVPEIQRQKLTFTEQAARRTECKRLQRFVKLTDYLMVHALHSLAVESSCDLLKVVFAGCKDEDVITMKSILNESLVNDTNLQDVTEGNTLSSTFENSLNQSLNHSQFGTMQFCNKVGTKELIESGFDTFPFIVSKLAKATVFKMNLMEVKDESGHAFSAEDEMEVDLQPPANEVIKKGKDMNKDAKLKEKPFIPLFKTELLIKLEQNQKFLYFSPSMDDFLALLEVLLKLYLSVVESVPVFTNTIAYLNPENQSGDTDVKGLEESEFGEGPQINQIITEGAFFKETCGRIRGSLMGIFLNAKKWMRSLDEVRNMYVGNEKFNALKEVELAAGKIALVVINANVEQAEGGVLAALTSYNAELSKAEAEAATLLKAEGQVDAKNDGKPTKSEPVKLEPAKTDASQQLSFLKVSSTIRQKPDGTYHSPLVDFFEKSLQNFSLQLEAMNAIPLSECITNLLVQTENLREVLLPSPRKCFDDVASILPGLARDKNELLLSEVQIWVRILQSPPQNVEAFVEYLGWLETVKSSIHLTEHYYNEVTRLYSLIENYKIQIQPTDYALFQTLGPTLRQLKESVDMASDTKEDNISRFSLELEKQTSELMAEVAEIRNKAQDPMVLNPGAKSDLVIKFLDELRAQLDKLEASKIKYGAWDELFKNGGCTILTIEKKEEGQKVAKVGEKNAELEETKNELELKRVLWKSLSDWEVITTQWRNASFDTLNTEEINSQISGYLKIVYSLDKGLPPNDVVPKLKAMVDEYKAMYQTIVDLRNPALKPRHWDKIQDAIGKVLVKDESFTLGKLIELRVFEFKEEISTVSAQAGSEAALEEMLSKVVRTWNDVEFTVINYRDAKDVFILGAVDDIQTFLEDSQVTIATIKGSRFIGPIKTEVDKWDKQLSLFSETLDAWLVCQRNWLYLESIFSAPDIQRQLPDEARMFSQVDRSWKDVMRKVSRNSNAMKAGTMPGVLEIMQQNNILLDQIQKCLEDYLESKRLLFPRFYFLSNEELLEILSQTRNPQAVQPHLSKCFDAIKSLEFNSLDSKAIDIVAMISPEGERVPFLKTIKARGNVESWLGSVEEAMVAVLRKLLKVSLGEYEDSKRSDWVREHVGQIVVTGNQVIWCRDVSECLRNNDALKSLTALKQKWITNLSQLANLVRGELSKIQRAILGALITIDVHNRDIIQSMIKAGVTSSGDFEWTKQLRYYWNVDADTCHVKMSSSTFNYGYEYLGCSPRLVITPLTDRCYLTLTGAMQLNLGGSPVGPAGTGKTETVKDLAKALSRQCVVFNCSDGMDYKMMGKMFAGLAQSGAWCCFDEFNRIDIEVLSVVAQQLLTIKNAKDVKAIKFMFEGREIRLIDTCCAFITMNPGYAGRTELPDNLKALFRPISMMIPDYGLIAEIMLFSEGFENAKLFSGKVFNLYKLCSEQLSKQDHYDFGMRAVKSVLIMAGALKRSSPDLSEEIVLIRSLRDSNLPKFLAEDVGLFKGILNDLFPGVKIIEQDFGKFVEIMREVLLKKNLEVVDSFNTRIIQLYETMKIRHGVMLVGPTGGGKTTNYEVLQETLNVIHERYPSSEFQKVKTWVINPKCVNMTELYGEFNLATMEWKDGLIGSIFRAQVADDTPDEKWTVCDGPVDALWIENMNTVLDDNKLLTLINGERIKMNSTMHMLFEVADLAVASPATVSRTGMVYMDTADLGWRPFVKKWIRELSAHISMELKDQLYVYFDTYIDKGLRFVRKSCIEYMNSVDLNLVGSVCRLLTTFLTKTKEIDFTMNAVELRVLFGHIFIFCYAWGLGGNLADGSQENFDSFMHDLFETTNIQDVPLPSSNSIFCYYVDLRTRAFNLWDDLVPTFKYETGIPYFQMIVPTTDTVKYSYLLENLLANGFPTLLTGNTGVGKSIIVQDLLNRVSKTNGYMPLVMNFSAQTSSMMTQQIIELKMEKKRKNILGAPTGFTKVVLFVDDLNMPKLDTYGSQPTIELIRQYLDFGGFYDREKLTWKIIQDVEVVAACAPPGGGRNKITPRLLRHFNLFSIPVPNEQVLSKIFRSIIEGFLKPFVAEVRSLSEAIVNSSTEIYHRMCLELLPTPAKSHYTFNLRDLSKVVQGILQVFPTVIQTKNDMARLFCHESSRIFYDRLIDDADRQYFNKLLSELVEKNFGISIPKEHLAKKPILFGDFLKRAVPVDERIYLEIPDSKQLGEIVN